MHSIFFFFTENGIFGVPLVTLMEHDQKLKQNTRIPLVFKEVSLVQNVLLHLVFQTYGGLSPSLLKNKGDLKKKWGTKPSGNKRSPGCLRHVI